MTDTNDGTTDPGVDTQEHSDTERAAGDDADGVASTESGTARLTRRGALTASGLLALLGLGARPTGADPQGQVGTDSDPLQVLYSGKMDSGSTDSIVFEVGGDRALLLGSEAASGAAGNVVAGNSSNGVATGVEGGTVSGGGLDGTPNTVYDGFGTIGGGTGNRAGGSDGDPLSSLYATVGGGRGNTANGYAATVAGGQSNYATGRLSTVTGGQRNDATARGATVGGGELSTASGEHATAGGGERNTAGGNGATVAGGEANESTGDRAFVGGGGQGEQDGGNRASGAASTVCGGEGNEATSAWTTVGGGLSNEASNSFATTGGGVGNVASGNYATVGGGDDNVASARWTTVGGGQFNTASGVGAVVGGGGDGGEGGIRGGGTRSNANQALDEHCTVAGGLRNLAGDSNGDGTHATVGGGVGNTASGEESTVAGGERNTARGVHATVGGGTGNLASGDFATVAGGGANEASGGRATVVGGSANVASGLNSVAAGASAEATHDGTFVWADFSSDAFSSTAENQFLVDADGGVGLGTNDPQTQLHVQEETSGAASTSNHVAAVENAASDGGDVLALITGTSSADSGENFVTFTDGSGDIGAIEGDGSGGINLKSGGGDYAEMLPRVDPDEPIEPTDVVGVVAGAVTRRTGEADQALVVSDRSIVTGNSPGPTAEDREPYEVCAFVGQVPVKVRGPVEDGDLIVPSGTDDGTGRAVAPADYTHEDGPIVGRAWEASPSEDVEEVTVAVGLETGEALADELDRQRDTVAALGAELEARDEEIERQDERIDALEAENDHLRERLAAFEDRLASVERSQATPTPGDD